MTKYPPVECPVCGAPVPRNAKACPNCGADERSGWNDEATLYDGIDLPDEAFGDAPSEAQRARAGGRRKFVSLALAVVALILVVAFVYAAIHGEF
ncbi:MAG: zinc-ribbon domain-containing protein [Opitutaceae bacterium]